MELHGILTTGIPAPIHPPPTFPSEDHPLPAPYELDNQMDTTEDLVVQDPEASGVMLTDEQLAKELYGSQKEP